MAGTAASLASRARFDRALEYGICHAPGDVFSASARCGNWLRISCGHGWDTRIERGPTALGELACAMVRR